jgi:hypothetical protein
MPLGGGCPRGPGVATTVAGRRGCVAGLAVIGYAQPAPIMTIFDLMVRVLA